MTSSPSVHTNDTHIKLIYTLASYSYKPLGHIRLIYFSAAPVLEGCGLTWTTWIWTIETTKNHNACYPFCIFCCYFFLKLLFAVRKYFAVHQLVFPSEIIKLYFYFSNQFYLIYLLAHLHPPSNNTYSKYGLEQIHQRYIVSVTPLQCFSTLHTYLLKSLRWLGFKSNQTQDSPFSLYYLSSPLMGHRAWA